MKALLIMIVILASVCLILGIVVLSRKGDGIFLAMNNDDKEKYNIERLRLVGGIVLILDAVALSLFSFLTGWSIMIFAALNFVGGILQSTWAKRKKDSNL